MTAWFASLPCSTCRATLGPRGIYVASGVQFCAGCLPHVLAVLTEKATATP